MYGVRNIKVKLELNLTRDAKNNRCVSQKRKVKVSGTPLCKAGKLEKQSMRRLKYSTNFLLHPTKATSFPTPPE